MGGDSPALSPRRAPPVSIHAPAWGATADRLSCRPIDVSIHAPAWGATATGKCRATPVSIHAPAWGATCSGLPTKIAREFQSTPPRGGDRRSGRFWRAFEGFQSTPPRGGRHEIRRAWRRHHVSIHAPAWGATAPRAPTVREVSIHAPAWGATPIRPRDWPDGVSIHAPAWGATRSSVDRRRREVSIHAPAWGATRRPSSRVTASLFQSTPPRGGRRARAAASASTFQSTPPRGGRRPGCHEAVVQSSQVSIHAPAWGATRVAGDRPTRPTFQSTPPRGGRPSRARSSPLRFQSTPPRGGRQQLDDGPDPVAMFQSTPPRGGRLARSRADRARQVSIHAPAWGATTDRHPLRSGTCFNPRPRVGGDRRCARSAELRFQSTPPRGGRPQLRRAR